ncbi:MAG TPA: DUF1573 domain-containing protein [Chitinophagaceae bacterium]|jgi:hypothetical protein|nr:DUF1573 domain-containing protein [Chitinophagaceae bacterium]HQV85154.1 DUF1573 domain-containing protein [Chitinophagaceae bacterium]HQX71330.1 DUF1573 domain-containing protein [Chitinophagaceae bacterium]HQZ74741.1 DUF1573 domain-containing protein [Chitinophagaceae bacterium]
MKNGALLLLVAFGFVACKNMDKKEAPVVTMSKEEIEKAKNDTTNFTTIQWLDSTTQNLGKLTKDKEIEITWRFKNSGSKNLIIENVSASCGCTIPEKPEQPFAPGQEGTIKAKFNGSGSGTITKQVHVIANTNPAKDHTLTFVGEINDKQ